MILLGSFLLLVIVVIGLISTSYVQTRIVNQLAQNFTKATQQQVSFEDLQLKWNGKLEFKNFYLEDHHNDTLLYISTLNTSLLNFKQFKQADFELSELSAKGVYLNLKKYKGEEEHSLKIMFNKFKKNDSLKRKTFLKVVEIDLDQVAFVFLDENQEQAKPLQLQSLNISASDLQFKDQHLQVAVNNLEGKIQTSKIKPFTISAFVNYDPGKLSLEELRMTSEESWLQGKLELIGKDNSFRNFTSNVNIALNVDSGHLNPTSLFPEYLNLKTLPTLDITFNALGTLTELDLNPLKVSSPLLDYSGRIYTKNILEVAQSSWILDVDSLRIQTQRLEPLTFIPNEFKKPMSLVNSLLLQGTTTIDKDSIGFDFNSKNTWGSFSLLGNIGKGILDQRKSDKKMNLTAVIETLDVSPWLANNEVLDIAANLKIQGDFANENNPTILWEVNEAAVQSEKLKLQGIAFKGRIEARQLRNTLSINAPSVKLKSDVLYNYKSKPPQITLLANINKWDLNTIGLELGNGKRNFKGVVSSNLKGDRLDLLEGEIKISSASIENEKQTIILNPISISQILDGDQTLLKIDNTNCIAGEAKGNFKTKELNALFQNTVHQVYPFFPKRKVSPGQNVSFKLKIFKKLLDALYPDFSISENITLNGSLNSDEAHSQLVLDAPLMRFKDIQFQKLHFQVDTKNPLYNTFLSVDKVLHKFYKGTDFNLISTRLRDTLFFRSEFEGTANAKTPFEINFYHTRDSLGTSHFGLKKSIIPLGIEAWTLNPENKSNQKISYISRGQQVQLSELKMTSRDQSISLSGNFLNQNSFRLDLDVQNVFLENILPAIPNFKIAGKTNLKTSITRSRTENELNISANVENVSINDQALGELSFSSQGNTKLNTYLANLSLVKASEKKLSLKGLWQGLEAPTLNFSLNFDHFDIAFLSPLGKNALNQIRGKVTGDVSLWGPLKNLKHDGELNWRQGGFAVPYLNVNYDIEPTKVKLNSQDFIFIDTQLKDTAEETTALLEGRFSHSNFSNWIADLDIRSDRMLLLNTVKEPESLFFGQGFLEGIVQLKGPTKNLKISLQGTSESGTSIKIPWAENYGLSDTSFVSFVNKTKRIGFESEEKAQRLKEIKGLELDFELDVNNNASVEIVIDQETGSYLSGRGAGNLLMEINTKGKFNMWGDFITYDGIYNFKNLGVIDKKFNVKPGGTIVWEGDPLEAQMDLEAVYDVPGGANPALLLDNPNFNKNIPTEVLIRLQGNLLKPDDPIFEIGFPNTSGTVASEINYRLADPQRSQLQAISLLSQGIFINEVSVSMQGITNNLYQKASDIISNLIGEEGDKLKVGIDYLQGDKSALLDIATEDRLGFTLSTKISDKILLNGKIGVPVGGLEQTLIVGNVQIDFILNEEGSLRAKVFNKENEFRYIGDELGYTQGIGLSYDVDFNTFKELIQKILAKKNNSDENLTSLGSAPENDLIQFVKKN